MFFNKKAAHEPACMIYHLVVAVFLFLMSIASLIGVIMTHIEVTDTNVALIFGSSQASLAILAFVFTTKAFFGQLKVCVTKCEVCK